jgi:hypothetical protein
MQITLIFHIKEQFDFRITTTIKGPIAGIVAGYEIPFAINPEKATAAKPGSVYFSFSTSHN